MKYYRGLAYFEHNNNNGKTLTGTNDARNNFCLWTPEAFKMIYFDLN